MRFPCSPLRKASANRRFREPLPIFRAVELPRRLGVGVVETAHMRIWSTALYAYQVCSATTSTEVGVQLIRDVRRTNSRLRRSKSFRGTAAIFLSYSGSVMN